MGYRATTSTAARHRRPVHRVGRPGGSAGSPLRRPALPARIVGVDNSDAALDYARRNAAGTTVELVRADVIELARVPGSPPDLDGRVDLVVANPPYVPDGAVLEPEVAQHDPHHAVFGGPDGLAVIAPLSNWPAGGCGRAD